MAPNPLIAEHSGVFMCELDWEDPQPDCHLPSRLDNPSLLLLLAVLPYIHSSHRYGLVMELFDISEEPPSYRFDDAAVCDLAALAMQTMYQVGICSLDLVLLQLVWVADRSG